MNIMEIITVNYCRPRLEYLQLDISEEGDEIYGSLLIFSEHDKKFRFFFASFVQFVIPFFPVFVPIYP